MMFAEERVAFVLFVSFAVTFQRCASAPYRSLRFEKVGSEFNETPA
jgi:hypothetical protein